MATFTYDLSTTIGLCRRDLRDTDKDNHIWSDDEISSFLKQSDQEPRLAAAMALEAECTEQSRGASIIRLGPFGDNEAEAYKAMEAQAKRLRATVIIVPSVTDIVPSITLASAAGAVGSLDFDD